ncbi:MAG: hypothetical protein IKI64_08850 [Clostridia bacterium]|nr:hypothetical protein [Clostridia bacterium]
MRNPLKLDSYSVRSNVSKKMYAPESLFSSSVIANICVLFLTLVDLFAIKTLWNYLLTDNPEMVWLVSLGFALILDVPMSVAGNSYKQYKQGLRTKESAWLILILCIAAFTLAFGLLLALRLEARSVLFGSIGSSAAGLLDHTGTAAVAAADTEKTVFLSALTMSMLPAATSIAAFVITFSVSNPRREKLCKLSKLRCKVQARQADLIAAVSQSDSVESVVSELENREQALYTSHIDQIEAQGAVLKQRARMLLMQKLGGADAITTISESADEVIDELEDSSNLPPEPADRSSSITTISAS